MLESGEVVDFDLAPGGSPRFDRWRLQQFLESRSERFEPESLGNELTDAVARGVLSSPAHGWFRLA